MTQPAIIQLEQVYPHPPSAIWKCLTIPELHAKWWAAGDVKAEVGHRFELDMGHFGKQVCQVLEVIPEQRLKYSFSEVLNSTITWELSVKENGTLLKLTHEGFDLDSPLGQQAYNGMKNGWPGILLRIQTALSA